LSNTTPNPLMSGADWQNFAADIIDHLLKSGCGRWSHRVIRDAEPTQPHKPTAPAPRKKLGGTDQSGLDSADDIDSILDEIEDEDFGPLLPPCPASEDIVPRERRPLASTATIAVQLGRQFHNATGLSRALSVPGGITHIATGAPELDESTIKILDALSRPDGLCAVAASPVIFSAGEIMALGSKPKTRVLGTFDDKFRDAVIENRMIVVVSDAFQSLPPEVAALVTQRIALPTLDAPMLSEVLNHLFPGSTPVKGEDPDATSPQEKLTRHVPIHSHLIDLGLMDHVQAMRDNGETFLFPDVIPKPRNGSALPPVDELNVDKFGDVIDYTWRKSLEIALDGNPRKLCLHSLRHYVNNTLIHAEGVHEVTRFDILGHVSDDGEDDRKTVVNTSTYRDDTRMAIKSAAIERLERVF
jgi:hypothetical protein